MKRITKRMIRLALQSLILLGSTLSLIGICYLCRNNAILFFCVSSLMVLVIVLASGFAGFEAGWQCCDEDNDQEFYK